MNMRYFTLVGAVLLLVGSIKTYMHLSMGSVIALPTCTGRNVLISVSQGSFFEQAHCWGCYMALAGLMVLGWTLLYDLQQKRTQAFNLD